MEMSLTTNNLLMAVAISSLMVFTANAAPADGHNYLASSFPEKVGPFARGLGKTNETAIHGTSSMRR
jgi:hypothetical protein